MDGTGGGKVGPFPKPILGILLLLAILALSGCQGVRFYAQAIKGQYVLLSEGRAIEKLLKNSRTPPELVERLRLVNELRCFAEAEMKLPVDDHYRKYVDVHRPYVVWNVQAAPEFSMEPKTWWYPLVGRLDYRGYFSHGRAEEYGQVLLHKGYDVYVGGVTAYSTLGWFKDPVLNTFLFEPETEVAETIFHELAHQQVFAKGDTDFNEAFATTVGQEATRRWLQASRRPEQLRQYQEYLQHNSQFVAIVMKARARLEETYGDTRDEKGKIRARRTGPRLPPEETRTQKAEILRDLHHDYTVLKERWGGEPMYDRWFEPGVNNAKLNSVAAYYDLVPGFERLLELDGGDPVRFYASAKRLAEMSKKERQQWLRALGQSKTPQPLKTQ